jgi:L-fuconolactonase
LGAEEEGLTRMPVIDAQVHCYGRNTPDSPWTDPFPGPAEMTGEDMVKAMDDVGVDGALLTSVFAIYRFEASYAIAVRKKHPGRFALIKPVDANDPAVAETIADWAAMPGTVGVRIMMRPEISSDPAAPGLNRILAAGARHNLPVNIQCWGRLPQVGALAARNPATQIVVDHVGMTQVFAPPARPQPFDDLPNVLALAQHENLAIKITGACTYSHEAFPYRDIWDPLARVFDAFGLERCLWGTDWTRATALLTYKEGVDAFRVTDRLSDSDRAMLMGGSLQKIYGWTPVK